MNTFPLWKYVLVVVVAALAVVYALPNIYTPDPAIQVSGISAEYVPNEQTLTQLKQTLSKLDIDHFGETIEDGRILVRLNDRGDQMRARREVETALGDNFVVAVNLAPTTPDWLRSMGASRMNLGLDLAGGVHFLLEVDTQKVIKDTVESLQGTLKREIRKNNLRGVFVRSGGTSLRITAKTAELRDAVQAIIRKDMPELLLERSEEEGSFVIKAQLTEEFVREKEDYAVEQNLATLRNRVNAIGVAEPLVQKQGRNRIVVQLPGVQEASDAKKILGKTANLEFRLEADREARATQRESFPFKSKNDQRAFGNANLERSVIVYGRNVVNARSSFDQETNAPQVSITLDGDGAARMNKVSGKNIGRRMGVLFIEYKAVTRSYQNSEGELVTETRQVPEKKVISLATIQAALPKNFVITGLDSPQEASELALLLRSGALAAPMTYVEERTIGPSLGAENIALGVKSVQIGLALVLLFMLVYYKVFGLAANIALSLNLVLVVAIMSMLGGATLTLPGIAGIVLTVGMAVDANVLIFSRIREELNNGVPVQSSIKSGFERAFITILDANLTTLIVAVILFAIGSGPVKGFAVTLSIGILTSMFTAIIVTRALVNIVYGGRTVKKLWI